MAMNLKDLGRLELFKNLAGMDKDDLLEAMGLESKKTAADYVVPGLLIFGAGVAVGAGIGMLLAPRAGAELRGQLGEALGRGLEQGKQQIDQMKQKMQQPPQGQSGQA